MDIEKSAEEMWAAITAFHDKAELVQVIKSSEQGASIWGVYRGRSRSDAFVGVGVDKQAAIRDAYSRVPKPAAPAVIEEVETAEAGQMCVQCGEPVEAPHHVDGFCYCGGSVNAWLACVSAASAKSEEQIERNPSDVPVKGECACGHPAFTHRDSEIERYCMIHGCGCECFWPTTTTVPAQGDGEPDAQMIAKRLANAIQFFRNCPSLGNLTKLRETPEYHELCSAWRAYTYLTDTWTDALAELKEYQQREEAVGGDGEDAQTFEQVISGLRDLEPFWSKAAQDEIKAHENTKAKLAAARERISELESAGDAMERSLKLVGKQSVKPHATYIPASTFDEVCAALRTYATAKGEAQ